MAWVNSEPGRHTEPFLYSHLELDAGVAFLNSRRERQRREILKPGASAERSGARRPWEVPPTKGLGLKGRNTHRISPFQGWI